MGSLGLRNSRSLESSSQKKLRLVETGGQMKNCLKCGKPFEPKRKEQSSATTSAVSILNGVGVVVGSGIQE